jgi:hypothetical protein
MWMLSFVATARQRAANKTLKGRLILGHCLYSFQSQLNFLEFMVG